MQYRQAHDDSIDWSGQWTSQAPHKHHDSRPWCGALLHTARMGGNLMAAMCIVDSDECTGDGTAIARGLCSKHYNRMKRTGTVEAIGYNGHQRYDPWVNRYHVDDNGCWIWDGHIDKGGYGVVAKKHHNCTQAHRAMFIEHNPCIDISNKHIDHLCRNRSCVNPDHLEPVARDENYRRGKNGVLRTHCGSGVHEWKPENWVVRRDGTKRCGHCDRARALSRRKK